MSSFRSRKNKKPKLPTKKATEHDRLMENQTTLTQMDFFTEKDNATNNTNEVRMIMEYYYSVYFIVFSLMMLSISTSNTYILPLLDIMTIILTPTPAPDLHCNPSSMLKSPPPLLKSPPPPASMQASSSIANNSVTTTPTIDSPHTYASPNTMPPT